MKDTKSIQSDLEILTQLNAEHLVSDQNGDVQRYGQILAEDFMSSLPDFLLRNKKQFLEMMTVPRPFTELKMDDVRIRLLGGFRDYPLTHDLQNERRCITSSRYTDDWQRRDGKWLCVAANVIAGGL